MSASHRKVSDAQIAEALARTGGNAGRAAGLLGVDTQTVRQRAKASPALNHLYRRRPRGTRAKYSKELILEVVRGSESLGEASIKLVGHRSNGIATILNRCGDPDVLTAVEELRGRQEGVIRAREQRELDDAAARLRAARTRADAIHAAEAEYLTMRAEWIERYADEVPLAVLAKICGVSRERVRQIRAEHKTTEDHEGNQ